LSLDQQVTMTTRTLSGGSLPVIG